MTLVERIRKQSFLLAGVLDSAVIAGCGFLLNLLCGRYLDVDSYGFFLTLYTIASLSLIFQASLASNPYVVLSQSLEEERREPYFAGTFLMTLLLGAGTALSSVLAFSVYWPIDRGVLGAFALYIFLSHIQDFLRRCFYTHHLEGQALLLDTISYGGQILAAFFLARQLTLQITFSIMAGTTILGLAVMLLLNWTVISSGLRCVLTRPFWKAAWSGVIGNWMFGGWILVSNLVSWSAGQFYVLALGRFHTPAAVAQLGAARTIAAASNPLVLAYEAIGLPRMIRNLKSQGTIAFRNTVVLTAIAGGVFFLLFGAIFFFYPGPMMHWIFGKSFGDMDLLVRIFSILPMLWFVGKVFSIAVLALERPQALFSVYVAACAVTLTAGIWLISQFGAVGAGWGFLLNALILCGGFILQFFRELRRYPVPASGPIPLKSDVEACLSEIREEAL